MTSQQPERLELRVGERHELTLPGLGTAGYRWTHTIEGDAGVLTAEWTRAPARPGQPIGASAQERLLLTATASGLVRLRLEQSRAWESGRPRDERSLDVVVLPESGPTSSRP